MARPHTLAENVRSRSYGEKRPCFSSRQRRLERCYIFWNSLWWVVMYTKIWKGQQHDLSAAHISKTFLHKILIPYSLWHLCKCFKYTSENLPFSTTKNCTIFGHCNGKFHHWRHWKLSKWYNSFAASDENFVKMTFSFQWLCFLLCGYNISP